MRMLLFWNCQWALIYFLFGQSNIYDVATVNFSNIQLLGLFESVSNSSEITERSVHSCAMFKSAILLSRQYNITIEGQVIEWKLLETDGNAMEALMKTCQIVSGSNVVGIVGPELSREARLIAPFAKTIGIPVVSHIATDPSLSDRNIYSTFYRTIPSDNAAASAIVELFLRFNWTSCIVVYQNDAFGFGGVNVISEAFINNGLIVQDSIIFDIATLSIRGDLKDYLINSPTRIVVLWAQSTYIPIILQSALTSAVVGPQFTWILSSSVALNSFHEKFHENLIGMFSIEPDVGSDVNAQVNATLLNAAYQIWQEYEPESFPGSTKVSFDGLLAFDATWLLIQSLQKLSSTILNNSSWLSFSETSFCYDRRFIYSDLLLNVISTTQFLGVSGPIKFTFNATDRVSGTSYYAKNVQHSSSDVNFVPVLEYSARNGWKSYQGADNIIWPVECSQIR